MRVLVVSPHFPRFPSTGSDVRVFCLMREGAARHRYHLVGAHHYGQPPDPEGLASICEAWDQVSAPAPPVRGRLGRLALRLRESWSARPRAVESLMALRRPMRKSIRKILDTLDPQVAFVIHTVMAPVVERIAGLPPMVVDVHDLAWMICERQAAVAAGAAARSAALRQARLTRAVEARLFRSEATFACCSDVDRRQILEMAPSARVVVVPNGVDVDYFSPAPVGTPGRLVFTGNMVTRPNEDAAVWFCNSILERVGRHRPEAHLDVVGLDPGPAVRALAGPRVSVHGGVPDVRPFLASAEVVVVPLRIGSGTRLKILEAMAMGRPVVSTRVGAEGLDLRDGVDALLADTEEEFADRVLTLLGDEDLRQRLAGNGRQLVEERYSWRALAPKLDQAFEMAVGVRV